MKTPRTLPEDTVDVMNELLARGDLPAHARDRAIGIRAMANGFSNLEVAKLVDVHPNTVTKWRRRYLDEGPAFVLGEAWGGRRNNLLDADAEREFIAAFEQAAQRGELVTVNVISKALAERLGHEVWPKNVYRMLQRHGWRKIVPRPAHPGASAERREAFKETLQRSWQPPSGMTADR